MNRFTRVLAAFAIFAAGAFVAWAAADDAPAQQAFAATTCSTGLIRTNNSGNSPLNIPCIPNTPCWRSGSQTWRPADVAFSACTAPVTTTTVAPTTTLPATTTVPTPSTTTIPPTSTSSTSSPPTSTTTAPASTSTSPPPTLPAGVQFSETFDNNSGLNRFRWGVYHRSAGYREMDQPQTFFGPSNISLAQGSWTGDHDLNCGTPDTQRPLKSEGTQDTTGQWGWHPQLNFHVDQDVYVCRDHIMSAMGEASGFSILWFAPDVSLPQVNSVSFEVNLTDLGARKWWKVGVVSDSLWNSTCSSDEFANPVLYRCIVVSDVGASNVSGSLQTSQRLLATWGGGASAGYPGCLKIGDNALTHVCTGQNNDKMTRFPVSLVDNHNGTITFTVNGTTITQPGSFPSCPCHVVFYDQNYTPDKDGPIQGYTWHWDAIVIR